MTENKTNPPVVILCGGQGTRLKEETEFKPKPMVEIGGKPILWHIMKSYSHFGFNRFILALGYKGDVIKNYFYNFKVSTSDFTVDLSEKATVRFHGKNDESNWQVTCVDTGDDTLKGGRIKRLEPYLSSSDRFHLTYGDGICNIDLKALDAFHKGLGSTGTVSVVHPPSRFGEIVMEGTLVSRFEEKPQLKTDYINGGFFVFQRAFLNLLTPDRDCDLEFGALQKLAASKELQAFKHDGFWQCMDNVRDRDYLNKLWSSQNAPWKSW